jgi:hypothetical protein
VISSPTRSLRHRTSWYTALGLAAILLAPPTAAARYELQDDTPPLVAYSIDGVDGSNGWYRGSTGGSYIVVHWTVADPESPVVSTTGCEPAIRIDDPNTGTTRTCSATSAGGTTAVTTKLLKVDATPPSTTVAASTAPNSAGWYRSPVSLDWSGTDGTSGIASCSSQLTYGGPDTTGASKSGSCTDNAGNTSSAALTIRYDSTPPSTHGTPSPAPNARGWLRSPVIVAWSGSDATSGIASCSASNGYSGPDSAGTTLSGSCTDYAGNSSSGGFVVRYDTHPPVTTAAPARAPNAAGWFRAPVTIFGSGVDTLSGVDSCGSAAYSGPDTAGASTSVTCTDAAGNTSSDAYTVKYDTTPPTLSGPTTERAPDHDGWYARPIHIDWHGTDAISGVVSCSSLTYAGPDDANAAAPGMCTDAAGNSSGQSFGLRYDATPPAVTVTAARPADHDGWYNHPVSISWSGTDATSGIDSCTAPLTYSGPDNSNASSGGHCTDHAGNTASPPALSFRYDATPPSAAPAPSRPPDAGGWYNHRLTVDWSGSDPTSGIASCSSYAYDGPDLPSVQPSGVCTDGAGNTSTPAAFSFRFDATPPTGIAAVPARPPDHDGWYNHPLPVQWSGSDALSGIASCTSESYGSLAAGAAVLSGGCSDQAGNSSSPVSFDLRYDQTPPAFARLALTALDGAVALRWRVSGATQVSVSRSPGIGGAATSVLYEGSAAAFADRKAENYVRYRYLVTAEDAAGNTLRRTAVSTPMPTLFAPRPGARLGAGSSPVFAWKPVAHTRYYNLQLWLGDRQVGSWWPSRPRLALPSHWRFGGDGQRLGPGDYAWYVWPGRGTKRAGRYGRLLGKSTFTAR